MVLDMVRLTHIPCSIRRKAMKPLLLVLILAAPVHARLVRWTDGENVALADENYFLWETLHSNDNFSVTYAGGTRFWIEFELDFSSGNAQATLVWPLNDILPREAVDDNGVTWHAVTHQEGPFAMWTSLEWLPDGTLRVDSFRHWSANLGIGGITEMDSQALILHTSPVPEPSTLLLALAALGVVGGWRRWGG